MDPRTSCAAAVKRLKAHAANLSQLARRGGRGALDFARRINRRRAARIAAAVAGVVAVLVWLVPNLALWFGWVDSYTTHRSDSLTLRLEGAWSPWPGRVSADRVHLVIDESDMDAEIDLKGVTLDVGLFALLNRHVSLSKLHADHGRVYLRNALASAAQGDAQPPIAGAKRAPDTSPRPPLQDPILLTVADLSLHLDEVWLDAMRAKGDIKVTGDFSYRPGRFLLVRRGHILGTHNELFAGRAERVSRSADLDLALSISRTDVSQDAWGLLDHLSGSLRLQVAADNARLLRRFAEDVPEPQGALEMGAELTFQDGTLAVPSVAWLTSKRLAVKYAGVAVAGAARALVAVDDARPARGRVEVRHFQLKFHGSGEGDGARAWWRLKSTSLRGLVAVGEVHAAVDDVVLRDVDLDASKLALKAKILRAHGTFDRWGDDSIGLDAAVLGKSVRLTQGAFGGFGNLEGSLRAHSARRALEGKLQVRLIGVSAWAEDRRANGMFVVLTVPNLTFIQDPRCLTGNISVFANESEPLSKLLDVGSFVRAIAPSGATRLDGSATVTAKGWSVTVDHGVIDGGRIELRGGLTYQRDLNGAFLVDAPILNVGVDVDHGEVDVSLFSSADPMKKHHPLTCSKPTES